MRHLRKLDPSTGWESTSLHGPIARSRTLCACGNMHTVVAKCSRMQDPVCSQRPPSSSFRARALPVVRGPRENSVKLEHLNTPLREISVYQINVMGKIMSIKPSIAPATAHLCGCPSMADSAPLG